MSITTEFCPSQQVALSYDANHNARSGYHGYRTDVKPSSLSCSGRLKLIAIMEEPAVTEKMLTHIGLDPQPPP